MRSAARADDWPQFRGPNASGVCRESLPLPAEIGPDKNLIWRTPLAKGHSSPVIVGERIYLTAQRGDKLLTIALDRATGKVVWEAAAPYDRLESVHRIGSRATPSVAADGQRVYSMFGSSGLACYGADGNLLWRLRMGPFDNQFGAASSPILYGDTLLLLEDHDTGSFLAAYDKLTGEQKWRVERPNFRRNYCSPVIWQVDGKPQVVVAGTAQVLGYDLATGQDLWTLRGVSRVVSSTPVAGDDGRLYVVNTGGSGGELYASWEELLVSSDANKNKLLEPAELPRTPIKSFFDQFDRDKSGALDQAEYESIREIFAISRSVALAVKPGGAGDITQSHVLWDTNRGIPRNASPLAYKGTLFLMNDGGVLTSLDAKTGQRLKSGRVSATGKHFSSPVCGDGKIYALDDRGRLSVITAQPQWEQIATADFGEDVYATPAIAGGRVYIRTVAALYCLGAK